MDPFEADAFELNTANRNRKGTAEAFIVSLLAFALSYAAVPDDPLALAAAFTWPVLAVLLVALRYGFPKGLLTVALLHFYPFALGHFDESWPPLAYSAGLVITSVIAGEFSENWERRLRTVERSNAYRQAKLEEFSQVYHILKLSHDRLEQENAASQTSLRSALLSVRGLFTHRVALADIAEEVLNLFLRYCAVRSATFFECETGNNQGTGLRLRASVGIETEVEPTDPLIQAALEDNVLTSVGPDNPELMAERKPGDPLIALPFVDSFGHLRGLLVVTEIPFFSFTERTLQLMTMLAGQIADFTRDRHTFPSDADPETATFVSECLRALEYAREFALVTSLCVVEFEDQTSAPAFIQTIQKQSRGLDRTQAVIHNDKRYVVLLMPLTGNEEFEQFLVRFNGYIEAHHGSNVQQAGINVVRNLVNASSSAKDLATFLSEPMGADNPLSSALSEHIAAGYRDVG